eukprot:993705-Rhodomonas_salina.1
MHAQRGAGAGAGDQRPASSNARLALSSLSFSSFALAAATFSPTLAPERHRPPTERGVAATGASYAQGQALCLGSPAAWPLPSRVQLRRSVAAAQVAGTLAEGPGQGGGGVQVEPYYGALV